MKPSKEINFQQFLLDGVDTDKIIIKYLQNKIGKVFLYHTDEK